MKGDGIDNIIQKADYIGQNVNYLRNVKTKIYGMALGQSNEILISVGETILKVVNNHSGKMSDSPFDTKPYYPTAIHVTSGGKVVVGGLRNDRGGVIVMDQKE